MASKNSLFYIKKKNRKQKTNTEMTFSLVINWTVLSSECLVFHVSECQVFLLFHENSKNSINFIFQMLICKEYKLTLNTNWNTPYGKIIKST